MVLYKDPLAQTSDDFQCVNASFWHIDTMWQNAVRLCHVLTTLYHSSASFHSLFSLRSVKVQLTPIIPIYNNHYLCIMFHIFIFLLLLLSSSFISISTSCNYSNLPMGSTEESLVLLLNNLVFIKAPDYNICKLKMASWEK